jgi:DNA-binding transcriptional LysR family regulator
MDETQVRLDDMRLVGALVGAGSFTAVARRLGLPKQTVSRRIAQLEGSLGVRLVDRTTRSLHLTALGRGYAERCAELVRMADELNVTVRGEVTDVSGTLRVTADPLFGEHFLPALIEEFVRAHPSVRVDAVLTSRYVELVEEGFDLAFRVGLPGDASLVATRVADATLVFVASPGYVSTRGAPRKPEDLAAHDCIALAPEGGPPRWAFPEGTGVRWVPVSPRIRVNHLGLAREAALQGLGITNLPYFACARALERGELVQVLAEHTVAFGGIHLVHPSRRLATARVRAFRELALDFLKRRTELHEKPGKSAPPPENRAQGPQRMQARPRPSTPRSQVARASVSSRPP